MKNTYGVYLPLYLQENVKFYLLYEEGDIYNLENFNF